MFDAIILMAGVGQRAELGYNKVFYHLFGKPIYQYSLEVFLNHKECNKVILVVNDNDISKININNPNIIITIGGPTRIDSVYNGLKQVNSPYVLIHDGARPNIDLKLVDNLYRDVKKNNAASLAVKVVNAIKLVNDNFIDKSLNRNNLIEMQTPQAINTSIYKNALEKAIKEGISVYDDMDVVLRYTDLKPVYTLGSHSNIKVTNNIDLKIIELIMKEKV